MSVCISTFVVHMRLRIRLRIFAVLFVRIICDLRRIELFIHGDDFPLGLTQKRVLRNGMNPSSKTHVATGIGLLIVQRAASVLALSIEADREKIGATEGAVRRIFRTMLEPLFRLVDDACKTASN